MVNELADKAAYEGFIQSHSDGLAVICFTVQWSGPCRTFAAEYEKIAQEYGSVAFARIDSEKNNEVALKESVQLVPAFCFYKKGQKVGNTIRGNASTVRDTIAAFRTSVK